MHEAEAAVPGDIETNYGTLGSLANAYYPDYQVNVGAFLRQMPGALANDPDPSVFLRGPSNSGTATNALIVPHTSPFATVKAPFTLECWMMATNEGTGQGDILSQADGSKTQGFRIYYQNNNTGNVAGLAYFGAASVGLTFTAGSASNQWHHLVWTCDARTNMAVYFDGVQGGVGGSKTTVAEVGKFRPDTHEPFAVGTGLGFQRAFSGLVDEVAIYTNVITDISQHYSDGTGGSAGAYYQDVINDSPAVYLRMNSFAYSVPSGPWPALVNYGQTNGVAVNNGVYTPGTIPGNVAGALYNNFPQNLSSANVAQLSGVSSFADAGYAPAYNPTGTTPFTVAAIFRGNPTDTNRVQSIVGHGTNSWELGMTVNGFVAFNSGTNSTAVVATGTGIGDLVSTTTGYDDGNWHTVAAVHNGTTNVLYLDGVPNNTNILGAANNVGNSLDVIIGSDPCYTNTPIGLGRQFAGQVCDVAFFTNALTAAQVLSLSSNLAYVVAITKQPVSSTNNQNTAYTNTVVASGTAPAYQWFQSTDGGNTYSPFAGQTNANLIFNPLLASDAGDWYVVVTNNYSSVTSVVVSLTINSSPIFTQNLPYTNLVLYAGGSATFSVLAAGAQPLYYYWFTNGVFAAVTNTSFTLTNVSGTSNLTNVYCLASNFVGTASAGMNVTILSNPALYPSAIIADLPIGFWRLNEGPDDGNGNQGVTAHDYWRGNNGYYTNTTLAGTGYNPNEPAETSALFGTLAIADSDVFGIPTNVDFSAANGSSRTFSVECWVKGIQQFNDAGIVTKGYGGAEQFDLDCGSDTITALNPTAHSFRWLVRNSAGAAFGVSSSINPADGAWHHLVGVCDEANGYLALYIDGLLMGTSTITPGSGILSSPRAMTIGSRSSTSTANNNWQFIGNMDDVSVYNYALSSNQVVAHYSAAEVPAFILVQPTNLNVTASQNGTVAFSAIAGGAQPIGYQWFDANTATPVLASATIGGSTNATLVLNNLQSSDSYYLQVTNYFGTNVSSTINLNVVSGQPQIYTDLQSQYSVLQGSTVLLPVAAYGTLPMTNQWQRSDLNMVSWTNVVNGGRITGSQSNVLTIANVQPSDAGDYQLTIANGAGGAASTVATLTVLPQPVNFYGTGQDWTANGSARFNNGYLSLTDPNNGGGTSSFFFQIPQYIGAFQAGFTYQAKSAGNGLADGATFCLQDDPRGVTAIASGGGGLGVGNAGGTGQITPSVELMLDIFGGSGYAVGTNGVNLPTSGATSPNFAAPGSVQLNSGHPITITVNYANGQMALTFTDTTTTTSFSTNLFVGDITKALGTNTAYIGFTGGYGGQTSVQTITNFTFVSIPTASIQLNSGNALVAWPGPVLGYLLQQNSDLTSPNWSDVTNVDTVVNSQHQVVVPSDGTNMFYRLLLQ